MTYCVRPMHREDIAQVTEIDREAFPTLWPPVNYQHELQNALARYIVVFDEGMTVEPREVPATPRKGLGGVLSRVWRAFNRSHSFDNEPTSGKQYIAGFAGLWIMADEAHITNIAVRESYRRRGIGELLFISMIDLAIGLKARIIMLEVRASNTIAQALYGKYGFTQLGLRRGYYRDNREDAIVMSTEDISSASFQSRFQQLKQASLRKLGIALNQISG